MGPAGGLGQIPSPPRRSNASSSTTFALEAQATEGAAFAKGLARSLRAAMRRRQASGRQARPRQTRPTEANRRPDATSLTCNRSSNCQNANLRTCRRRAGIL